MSWLGKLKAYHPRITQRDGTQQKRPALLSPEEAPATMSCFPADFHCYRYAGPAIEKVSYFSANREPTYRRALVARMVRKEEATPDPDGNAASTMMEMTASIRDLIKGKHPQTRQIALTLGDYYKTKVYGAEKPAPPQTAYNSAFRKSPAP